MENEKLETSKIVEAGVKETVELCRGRETILCIEDTTGATFNHNVVKELGDIGGVDGAKTRGYYNHNNFSS